MAKAGKIHHWKHGWIPLDATARAVVGDRAARAKARAAFKDPDVDDAGQGVTSTISGGFRITKVDGAPDVTFKEVVELDRRPPEQYRQVAMHAHKVLADYPKAGPVQIGFSDELDREVLADTRTAAPHKIRVSTRMWDDVAGTRADQKKMAENHFGLTAEAASLQDFRDDVLTHEIGHFLNMRDQDLHTRMEDGSEVSEDGPTDQFAFEMITPRSLGYASDGGKHTVRKPGAPSRLDKPTARWRIDSLHGRSAYATTDPYEFFAEAFLDGTKNGPNATDSGRRAVEQAKLALGGAS